MGFGLYSLLEASLLMVNAIAILNKDRFLSRIGWTNEQVAQFHGFGEQPGVKSQIVNLIHAVQTVMRVPLIFLNIFVIVIKLVLG